MLDSNAYSLSRVVGVLTLFTQFFHNNKKTNKPNESAKQKEKQTKTKETEENKNKIHGDIRKTLLTLNVTDECYS
jgi:hypothetical protein